MDERQVLVTVCTTVEESGLLLVDLDAGTYETLGAGHVRGIYGGEDDLLVAYLDQEQTTLAKYDHEGLVWTRRVAECTDTHSVTAVGDQIAVCSTGGNQIIFLDGEGVERRRWSPDPTAEGDSWHLNSLVYQDGRLVVSCFGRFDCFRGWSGRIEGAGRVLEIPSGRTLLDGLSAPHDPTRVEGGWIVNESVKSQLRFHPDDGPARTLASLPGFCRGLAVLPDVYVVGVSGHRLATGPRVRGGIALVDRRSGDVVRSIPLPYREVGHVIPVPGPGVIAALRHTRRAPLAPTLPDARPIPAADRAGAVEVLSQEPSADNPHLLAVRVRLTNRGTRTWSSEGLKGVQMGSLAVDAEGALATYDGPRTVLPIPVAPGKSLTFALTLDLSRCRRLPGAVGALLTLVQDGVAWWEPSDAWTPALVELARESTGAARAVVKTWWTQAQQRVEAARQELETTRQELETTRQELETTRQELETTRQELEAARQELVAARQELAAARQELAAARQELATTGAERETARRELFARVQELSAAGEALGASRQEISELRARLDGTQGMLEESRQACGRLQSDLEDARAALAPTADLGPTCLQAARLLQRAARACPWPARLVKRLLRPPAAPVAEPPAILPFAAAETDERVKQSRCG